MIINATLNGVVFKFDFLLIYYCVYIYNWFLTDLTAYDLPKLTN